LQIPPTTSILNPSEQKIRTLLFSDGAISCCSIENDAEKCCYTSPPDQEEGYFAFIDFLVKEKDYLVREIEGVSLPKAKPCPGCREEFLEKAKEILLTPR
jgi:hypothetical protein